jgi:hypothetical protein
MLFFLVILVIAGDKKTLRMTKVESVSSVDRKESIG